jgi:hypothetical protein
MKNKKEELKDRLNEKSKKQKNKSKKLSAIMHLGTSDAFSETENPQSKDADDISDEKLDELIGD